MDQRQHPKMSHSGSSGQEQTSKEQKSFDRQSSMFSDLFGFDLNSSLRESNEWIETLLLSDFVTLSNFTKWKASLISMSCLWIPMSRFINQATMTRAPTWSRPTTGATTGPSETRSRTKVECYWPKLSRRRRVAHQTCIISSYILQHSNCYPSNIH